MAQYPWEGKAVKIDDYDLPRIGHRIGVGEDEIHALLDVESRGTGFDRYGVIKLFEEHVMYRCLPVNQRDEAVALGIAYPEWRNNYKDHHERFLKAYAFNKDAALKACSWGLGQTLGENHIACGYNTPTQMVKAYAADEANQLEGMIQFIISNKLDDELRDHDWAGFARGYNGKYYYKHNYHIRLKDRYEWWQKKPDTPWSPDMAQQEEMVAVDDLKYNGPGVKPTTEDEVDIIIDNMTGVVDHEAAKARRNLYAGILATVLASATTAMASWWSDFVQWAGGIFQ